MLPIDIFQKICSFLKIKSKENKSKHISRSIVNFQKNSRRQITFETCFYTTLSNLTFINVIYEFDQND